MSYQLEFEKIENSNERIAFLTLPNGGVININEKFNIKVSDFSEFKNTNDYVMLDYSDWDGNEMIAIVNHHGNLICKGILSIETYIPKINSFIVRFSEYGIGDLNTTRVYFADNILYAVINNIGQLILESINDEKIIFDEEENCFWMGEKKKFSIEGEPFM